MYGYILCGISKSATRECHKNISQIQYYSFHTVDILKAHRFHKSPLASAETITHISIGVSGISTLKWPSLTSFGQHFTYTQFHSCTFIKSQCPKGADKVAQLFGLRVRASYIVGKSILHTCVSKMVTKICLFVGQQSIRLSHYMGRYFESGYERWKTGLKSMSGQNCRPECHAFYCTDPE